MLPNTFGFVFMLACFAVGVWWESHGRAERTRERDR